MAISSVSRIYDAPDPILEVDLELLGKVNAYQQAQFDHGAKELQNEINNWAMLADVAKPQDREYINAKLNNIVAAINNLGGVNLRDPNNVNSLKSLGYNLYGDNTVMNAVITTKKLRGFMTDAQTKLSGKNAANYDYTYYQYQLNKWNDWLQDGQVGTTFDGPAQLGEGSFENYQKKINDAINKLTPDSETAPVGNDAINYLQVGSKFIKKERINSLIDSLTTSQDREIISAHAWKNLGATPDDVLLKYTIDGYNSKLDALKSDYNALKHNMAQTTDFEQKQRYQDQINVVQNAIKNITATKDNLFNSTNGKSISEQDRDLLRSNLYFDSFKDQLSTARAFQQNATELKMNQGKAFQLKEARAAHEFSETMKWRKAQYNLDLRKQGFAEKKALAELGLVGMMGLGDQSIFSELGLLGPSSIAPLTVMEGLGKDDATIMNTETVTNANANYAAAASNFYLNAYNILGAIPEYQQYVTKQPNGTFAPVDDNAKKILDQAILNKIGVYDNIGRMPLEEREKYEKELSQDDAQLLRAYRSLKEAELYKSQVADLEDLAFRSAGVESPGEKQVNVYYVGVDRAKDQMVFRKPPEKISLRKLKELKDSNDPRLQAMLDQGARFRLNTYNDPRQFISFVEESKSIDNIIKNYYERAEDGWQKVSKNYSPFGRNVTLPKDKDGKVNQPLAQYFGDAVRRAAEAKGEGGVKSDVTESDVDVNRVWVKYDANGKDSKLRYMAEVKYKKGTAKHGDKLYTVDLTTDVINNPESYVAKLYPRDNAQIVYGLMMDKDGVTPLSESDNYTSALETYSNPALSHKFQIVARQNPNSTTLDRQFRVFMLVPKRDASGNVTYTKVPVRNTYNNLSYDFPANFDAVVDYMNQKFATKEKAREFYQINGIPVQ